MLEQFTRCMSRQRSVQAARFLFSPIRMKILGQQARSLHQSHSLLPQPELAVAEIHLLQQPHTTEKLPSFKIGRDTSRAETCIYPPSTHSSLY